MFDTKTQHKGFRRRYELNILTQNNIILTMEIGHKKAECVDHCSQNREGNNAMSFSKVPILYQNPQKCKNIVEVCPHNNQNAHCHNRIMKKRIHRKCRSNQLHGINENFNDNGNEESDSEVRFGRFWVISAHVNFGP